MVPYFLCGTIVSVLGGVSYKKALNGNSTESSLNDLEQGVYFCNYSTQASFLPAMAGYLLKISGIVLFCESTGGVPTKIWVSLYVNSTWSSWKGVSLT